MCIYTQFRFNNGLTCGPTAPRHPCKVVIDAGLQIPYCGAETPVYDAPVPPPPAMYHRRYRLMITIRRTDEPDLNQLRNTMQETGREFHRYHHENLEKYKEDLALDIAIYYDPLSDATSQKALNLLKTMMERRKRERDLDDLMKEAERRERDRYLDDLQKRALDTVKQSEKFKPKTT